MYDIEFTADTAQVEEATSYRINITANMANLEEIIENIPDEDVLNELDDDSIRQYAIDNLGLVEEEEK
jgi:hypothetical protein